MKKTVMAIKTVNAQADVAAALFNGGKLEMYGGSQPDNIDRDFIPHTALVVFDLNSPAFSKAQRGRIDLYPIDLAVVQNSGTLTWGRALAADGRKIMDFSVGNNDGFNAVVNKTTVQAGDELVLTRLSHTVAISSEGC